MHTRASRESPSPLSTKRRVLYEWEKEKKFNFVPSSLSLTHNYYLILSVKCVCSLFSLSGPVNKSDRMQTWGHVQSCLEIRKCQHIYIYNIPHFNSEFFSIDCWERFLSSNLRWYHFKKPFSTLIWMAKRKKNEEEQTKPAAIKIRVPQNRIEWKEHIKCINRFLYLNLQIKNFLSLSHSLYIHIKNILKKTKKRTATISIAAFIHIYTHNFNVSVLRTWCPPTSMRENSIETKRNKRANKSIKRNKKMKYNNTYICIYKMWRRKKFKNQKHWNRLSKKDRQRERNFFSLMRSSIVVIVILKRLKDMKNDQFLTI